MIGLKEKEDNTEKLTSLRNRNVKIWRKLLTKKGRREYNSFIVEGMHSVKDALNSSWEVECLIFSEHFKDIEKFNKFKVKKFIINNRITRLISQIESPQGIFAIVKIKEFSIDFKEKRFVILDRIQDPGNLGTIIRTADAAGFNTIILDKGSVDPLNPKVIRSSQGSLFHLKIINSDIKRIIEKLKDRGVKILGTSPKGNKIYTDVNIEDRLGIVFGNEANGIRDDVLSMCDETIRIPIYGRAESLNVSVSSGIILYHFAKK